MCISKNQFHSPYLSGIVVLGRVVSIGLHPRPILLRHHVVLARPLLRHVLLGVGVWRSSRSALRGNAWIVTRVHGGVHLSAHPHGLFVHAHGGAVHAHAIVHVHHGIVGRHV